MLRRNISCYSRNMKKSPSGFTLVEIMIVVAIIALLSAVLIPNMVRARVAANDSSAKATLKSISTALETYMTSNGTYPTTTTALVGAAPPYLNKDYFNGPENGFTFTATLTAGTYSIVATPASSNQGSTTFTITTGGLITP